MTPLPIHPGQLWRQRATGRVIEILELSQGVVNPSAKIRNVETGKIGWKLAPAIERGFEMVTAREAK